MTDNPKNPVALAMAAMAAVVAKDARNRHGGYDYASADAIYEHARQAIAEAGLTIWMREKKIWTTESSNGTQTLWVTYWIGFSVDGITPPKKKHRETTTANTYLTGPQSLGTVRTYAEKYWVRGKFLLATGDKAEDEGEIDAKAGGAPRLQQGPGTGHHDTAGKAMNADQAAAQWGLIDGQEEGGALLAWALDDPAQNSDIAYRGLYRKLGRMIQEIETTAPDEPEVQKTAVDTLFQQNDINGLFDAASDKTKTGFFNLWKQRSDNAHPLGEPRGAPMADANPNQHTTIASGADAREAGLMEDAAQLGRNLEATKMANQWTQDGDTLLYKWPLPNPVAAVWTEGFRFRLWRDLDDAISTFADEAGLAEYLDKLFEANSAHIGRLPQEERVRVSEFWAEHSPKAKEQMEAKAGGAAAKPGAKKS